jgi:hypothetical protein
MMKLRLRSRVETESGKKFVILDSWFIKNEYKILSHRSY